VFAIAALCGGCASILGLDGTHFDQKDAAIDAANVCDGMQAVCIVDDTTTTICGQILQAGASAGLALRAQQPTGQACGAGGMVDGPCELTGQAFELQQFLGGGSLGAPVTIDDCGRFSVENIDTNITDIAISFATLGGGSDFVQTATLVDGLTLTPALVTANALAVTPADEAGWSGMLGSADVSTGFLATFTADMMPLPGDAATIDGDGAFTNPPGTVPWAAYFSDAFGSFAGSAVGSAAVTQASGAAFVDAGSGSGSDGSFQLAGVRTGRRCKLPPMQQLPGTLLVVVVPDC
jgi:hypothetical protein